MTAQNNHVGEQARSGWHAAHTHRTHAGDSGPVGKEKVHFEALPSSRIPEVMTRFIRWFNDTAPGEKKRIRKAVVRSGRHACLL